MIRENKVKAMLKEGKPVYGTFVKMTDPSTMEIIGMSGLDFVVIDAEHTAYNNESLTNLIRTADISGIVPFIRIKENTAANAMQALDLGALGLQIPNVDTYDEAVLAVESCRYAPLGKRGFAPTHRAAGYGKMDKLEYIAMANKEILTILHCETIESVGNLDEMLKLEELDVVFIGPMDLSQSLGADVMGRGDHPKLKEAIDTIIEKTLAAGKVVGTVAGNAAGAKALVERGVKYVVVGSDQGFISAGCASIVNGLK